MTEAPTLKSAAVIPVVTAIGVFGVIYGAAAAEVMGPAAAIASSILVFSGAAQFSMVGLLASGATSVAVLAVVAILGLRHLPLGAILAPRLSGGRVAKATQSWFLVDETAGLAIASGGPPSRTLVVVGAAAYSAWVAGTALGVMGADVGGVESLANVVFPVLFVGLAALAARGRSDAYRAVATGLLSIALLLAWPAAGALGCMAVALFICLPGRAQ